ncbi:tetratricopeptide repeat protein [Kitasatospora sp. NPDC004240]
MGTYDEAIDAQSRALEIYRALGDRNDEAWILTRHGQALEELGRYSDALGSFTRALAVYRELGDAENEATVLSHLQRAEVLRSDRWWRRVRATRPGRSAG